jgi:phospho-N-acetylmuramoyl-pentapeptide-transferase
MLYYLHLLQDLFSPLRIFHYITVRAVAGAGTSFLLCVIFGPWVIEHLRRLKIGQYQRGKDHVAPIYDLHLHKEGTPTMGGVMIIGAVWISSLLWTIPGNLYVMLTVLTMSFMGLIGFLDDYTKVSRKNARGISARKKLIAQILWAVVLTYVLLNIPQTEERTRSLFLPFLKTPLIVNLGIIGALIFSAVVLIGATNAVNLTDGLDGLAIGCSSSVTLCYLVLAYVAGHAELARYLLVTAVPGAGELAVFCGCLAGACLGFLWHNCHPAQVFMGDTGSLALGGAIACVALLIKQELLLILVGGVFVMEAMSVILQVVSFKLRGKRIFLMAPIHHHFEMKKWSETQITIRFWILSIIFALIGLMSLKLR